MHKMFVMLTAVLMVTHFTLTPVALPTVLAQDQATYNDGTIRLQYPTEWTPTHSGEFLMAGVVIGPQKVELPLDGRAPMIEGNPSLQQALLSGPLIGVLHMPAYYIDLFDDAHTPQDLMKDLIDEYKVISTERSRAVTINGAEGVEAIGVVPAGDYLFGVHAVILKTNATLVYYFGGVLEAAFETYRASFEQILQSLVVLPLGTAVSAPQIDLEARGLTQHTNPDYTIGRPMDWQVSQVETFDGSLTVFCPEAFELVNADFETLLHWPGDSPDTPFNPSLTHCLLNNPLIAVVVFPTSWIQLGEWDFSGKDADYLGPARTFLQLMIYRMSYFWLGSLVIDLANEIELNGVRAAQVQGKVDLPTRLSENTTVGVYVLAVQAGDTLIVVATSSPFDQFATFTPLFHDVAHSLTTGRG